MKLPDNYQPAEQLLRNKIILVTGAGDGIGKVAAMTFAAHGATVVLLGRTLPKLEMVYDEIEAAGYPQPAIYPINFEGAVEKDYLDMCDTLDEAFGRIDGILHNAAELGERTPISNYSVDTWLRLMQVNVNAPFMLTKALLPLLENAPQASVLFTGSSVGLRGRAFWGAYGASKAAQENLMQTLAEELEGTTRIRVNSVNPGATRTAMRAQAMPGEDPETLPHPADVAAMILPLASPELKETGQLFDVPKNRFVAYRLPE
jgi:NAD(P)-dependent dehydrogenase (short-subunit alcohol dehydrogenase family)